MPNKSICELQDRDRIENAVYLLDQKQVRTTRDGKPYLDARLRDQSGMIQARLWDLPLGLDRRLEEGGGVQVSGEVVTYQGRLQIKVAAIEPCAINPQDFLPASSLSTATAQSQLQAYIGSVTDSWLRRLLEQIFGDPAFLSRFLEAPAAKEYHHACVGGLAEHTLAVAGLVETIVPRYPDLSRDLLLTGALLHDIGKVETYTWSTALGYSDEGELLGHIHLGVQRVEHAVAALPGFPVELHQFVAHAILSHHGEEENGSPVRPKTLEAVALHYLDTLDAHLRGFCDHLGRQQDQKSVWSERSTMFGSRLYQGGTRTSPRQEQHGYPHNDFA